MIVKEKLVKSRMFKNFMCQLPDSLIRLRKRPKVIIEVTNICNLKCPLCPTANCMKRKKGFMSLKNFKAITDDIKDIKSYITFNFAGEPTLNPDLFRIVKYATKNKMKTMVATNMTLLHNFDFKDIIRSGLTQLVMSVDGVSKETEEKYRIGADFNQIFKNMKSVVKAKEKLNSDFPIIDWQFIVMKHNQHEISKAIELAKELGINRLVLKSLDMSMGYDFSKENIHKIEKRTGIFLPVKKYSKQKAEKPIQICPWIWDSVILWNGDVTVCCFDFNGEAVVGNVFRDGGFKRIWESKKYAKTRKKIIKRELNICRTCKRMEETENLRSVITIRDYKDAIPKSYL